MTAQIAAGTPALLALLRKRLAAGDTITEAARALGVSPHRARGLIMRWGRQEGDPPRSTKKPKPPKPQASKPPPVVVAPPPPPELPGPRPGCCAWPEGEGRAIRFECRNAPQPGLSYCAEHCRRAFITVRVRTGTPIILQRLGTAL